MLDQLLLRYLFSGRNFAEQFFGSPAPDLRSIRIVRRIYHAFHVTTLTAKRATIIDPLLSVVFPGFSQRQTCCQPQPAKWRAAPSARSSR